MKTPKLTLLIFPAILIVVGYAFLQQITPVYAGASGYDADPAYVYLLSGLSILDGHAPTHNDHPGTPLQVLTAVAVFAQWLLFRLVGMGAPSVIGDAIRQPELYIYGISLGLLTLNAWALYYIGRRISQSTGSTTIALFCQTAPLAFSITAPRIVYFSPEALLVFASLCLLGLLAPLLAGGEARSHPLPEKTPCLAGLVCGFGIAVKVTFLPMLGLLFLLGCRAKIVQALKCATIGFVVCILPIVGNTANMAARLFSFAIHSGKYGMGDADVIAFGALQDRIVDLFQFFPFFFVVLFLLAVAAVWRTAPAENANTLVPRVLLAVGVFHTILVLKHPGPHYMVPVLPIAWIGAAWLVQAGSHKVRATNLFRTLPQTILLGIGCAMVVVSVVTAYDTLRESRTQIAKSQSAVQAQLAKSSDPLVIGTYRCALPECALSFGLHFAPQVVEKAAPILSNYYEYNVWNKLLLHHGQGWVSFREIEKHIANGGDVFLLSRKERDYSAFEMKIVYRDSFQILYRVTGISGETS